MNEEFDRIVAESLRDRAALAAVHGRGLGEVRRRVRRRRQRQMAVGLVPAMAGLGWAVTRPAAHTPLAPSGDAAPCGGSPSTGPTTYPATTVSGAFDATRTTWYTDANGNPTGTMFVGGATSTTITFPTDEIGNPATTVGDPAGTTTTTMPTAASASAVDSTTTTTMCVSSTVLVTTDAGPTTSTEQQTTSTSVVTGEFSSVLFVNASTINGAASAYAARYPGSSRDNATIKVEESYIMVMPGSEALAEQIANELGIVDWQNNNAPKVKAGIDATVVGAPVDSVRVVVVIGQNHAISLTAPTTTFQHT